MHPPSTAAHPLPGPHDRARVTALRRARHRERGLAAALRLGAPWLAAVGLATGSLRGDEPDVHELSLLTIAEQRADGTEDTTPWQAPYRDDAALPAGALPTLARSLAGLPGLVVQESFGGLDPPRFTVRGSGLQSAPVSRGVLWMLEGLPLNATDGSFNTGVFEPALFGPVRLVPGSEQPLASTTSLGGALAFAGSPEPAGPEAWLSVGSHGYRRAGVDSGTWIARTASMRAAVAFADWDGWRPNSAQARSALASAGRLRLGEDGPTLGLVAYAARTRLEVPGPLTLDAARRQPRSISALAAADRPRRETDFGHIALDATWNAGAGPGLTRLALAGQYTDDDFRQLRGNGITATAGGDLTALVEARRAHGAHVLSGGAIARSGSRRHSRWMHAGTARGSRFAELDLESDHAVAWLDDAWSPYAGLTFSAGLSLSDTARASRGTPAGAGRLAATDLAHRLSLAWTPAETLTVRAGLTRGFEPPAFDDLVVTRGAPGALTPGWSALRNQRSDTVEIGISGSVGAFAYTCTAYAGRWTDELLRLADASGAPLGTVNASRTRHTGLEAAARWRLAGNSRRSLDVSASHTWSRATLEDGPSFDGRHLAGLPPHAGHGELTWSGREGLVAATGATWLGGTTWADHANTLGYSGHVVARARVGWVDRRGWSLFLEVDNVFDRATIASTAGVIDLARNPGATALFLPGLPRQIRVAVRWRH